jgi:hypothetical protein
VRRALVALAATVATVAFAAPARAADVGVPAPSDFYGINGQWVFQSPVDTWPTQFTSMANGGLTIVRTDARWSVAEPTPPSPSGDHTYDWSTFDTIVGTLAQYGLRWMPTLDYPPPWAQENPTENTPEDPGGLGSEMKEANVPDFTAFAAAMVRRYGPGGTFWSEHPGLPEMPPRLWEIWNSPNVTYYWNPQDNAPERFADLYLATRAAMRAVNHKVVVMAGALDLVNPPIASDEVKFIKRMFAHRPEVKTDVDLWGLHPYQETIYWTYRRLAKWRQALDKLTGRRMPIAIDELGYTTTKVSDQMRGDELVELAQELPRAGCDVVDFMPYAWESAEQDPNNPEDWFGIWNHDGTPKPSGQRFVDAVLQMRGLSSTPPPTDQLDLCDSQYPVPPDPQPPVAPQHVTPTPAPKPGPAPTGPAPTPAPPKLRGPGIKVSVHKRHGLITVTASCSTACRLDGYLMTRRTGRHSRLHTQSVKHSSTFTTRSRTLHFRIPAHAAGLKPQAQIVVVSFDRSGMSSRATRKVRIR